MKNAENTLVSDTDRIAKEANGFASGLPQFLSQSWQGTLFSLERNSMKLTESTNLQESLLKAAEKELGGVPPEKLRIVIDQAKAVMMCFLQSKEVVMNVDDSGLADLARMAIASCKDPEYFEDAEIRIGFGAAPLESPNARVPAYTIAAKKILESLDQGRERAELLAQLDEISSKFPANKYNKLRNNILFSRPLSEEQMQLLATMQGALESLDPQVRQNAVDATRFPNRLPRVVLYSAHNFVGKTNGERDAVQNSAEVNMRYIQTFIEDACDPKIAERFLYDEDQEVEEASVLNRVIEYYAYAFRQATGEQTVQARDKVLSFGRKHAEDNEDGSLQYGVSHALYSADATRLPGVSILKKAPAKPQKVIMIGGEPEKVFWKVRQAVCREATPEESITYFRRRMEEIGVLAEESGYPDALSHVETGMSEEEEMLRVQLISKVGNIPVYSGEMAGEEPSIRTITSLSLNDLLQQKMGRTSVKEDLLYLIAELGGAPFDAVRTLAKGKQGNEDVMQAMEQGLLRLQQIAARVMQ